NALGDLYRRLKPDNTATVWDVATGKRISSIGESGSALAFQHATFSPDGSKLILIRDGAAELYEADAGQQMRSFRKPSTAVWRVPLSPTGGVLATVSDDRTAQLWNGATGELVPTPPQFQHGGQNLAPLFSPDSRLLVLGSQGGVRIWDAATGDPISPPF